MLLLVLARRNQEGWWFGPSRRFRCLPDCGAPDIALKGGQAPPEFDVENIPRGLVRLGYAVGANLEKKQRDEIGRAHV